MSPPREVYFWIDLIPGATLISKAPYRMAPTELKELRIPLDGLLEKGYIRPSTSPGGPCSLCKEQAWDLRLCTDYRELNNITIKNRCPQPQINYLFG